MPLNTAMSLMSTGEFLLWAILGFLFWTKGLQRRFPAMSSYLILRVGSMPILLGLLFIQAQPWVRQDVFFPMYFYAYWAVYIASAISLFFICIEVFRSALSAFSGLMKLGTVVFRWATLASLIVSITTLPFSHHGALIIPDVAYALMRSVSILELCLLGFLCLSMNALHLSVRDKAFGIALGFGLLSANDFILSSFWSRNTSLTSPLQFFNESLILATLCVWVAYTALREPARKPVVLAANSTIYRWNEIAAALGHGTKVAVQQPANSFFLTDVEKVVDKVLTRTNLRGSESKS
ncbi:MAG TPA: hypothetical protein VHW46_11065 [Terracidiphilus sp.]|jgi:hypothetical protein|nr:hypothetical protein [Terracidiphilus sp.]